MNIGMLVKRAGKLASDNSPSILTALGVMGTITSVYLTGEASFKAAKIISDAQKEHDGQEESHLFTTKEKTELVWKLYVPAAGTAALAVTCIIAANHIGTRRAAAFASAYSLSEKAFAEYKTKVVDKIGEKKEQEVRDDLAQDRVNSLGPVAVIEGDSVLCLDTHSGRTFESTKNEIEGSVNKLNAKVLNESYASVTDFWELIGLSKTAESDEIGWNTDKLLEVEFAAALTERGKPCLTIGFRTTPIRNYYRMSR